MSNNISVLLDFGTTETQRTVLKESNFTHVVFNKEGSVSEFTIGQKTYIATYYEGTANFFGFLEKNNYKTLKKRSKDNPKVKIDTKLWRTGEFTKDTITRLQLLRAEANDIIEGCFELAGADGVCKQFYKIAYTGTAPANNAFRQPGNIDQTRPPYDCWKFDANSQSGKFFDAYKNYPLYDNGVSNPDPALVGEISLLLQSMDKVVLESWLDFLSNPYTTENFFKKYDPAQAAPAVMFTRANFVSYRDGLKRWLQLLEQHKKDLANVKNMEHGKLLMLLFTMNREEMLRPMPVQIKIDALVALVSDHALISWFFSPSQKEFFNTEALAMNIINSVTPSQASDFIDLLETTQIKTEVRIGEAGVSPQETIIMSKNLYMALFKAIDDYGGKDNFTEFIYKISDLVAIKNHVASIHPSNAAGFSAAELQALKTNGTIRHSFFWHEKEGKGKTTYDVSVNTLGDKLTIKEKTCDSTIQVPHVDGDGMGPSTIWYTEECAHYSEVQFTNISHFSLVYVNFYDHPSFLDLRDDHGSYKGKSFFTFAGFFYYLQVKEETYWKETIFNACLFAISVIAPFGEVVMALKNLEYLHGIVGLMSLAGNTAMYLTSNTSFTNYLVQHYPNDYNDIITVLNIASILSFANIGSQPSAISSLEEDIVSKISKTDAGEYLGIAREVIKDEDAMAMLSLVEQKQLTDLVRKIENELYKFHDIPEIKQLILQEQGKFKFYRNVELRAELLQELTAAERITFLQDFASLEGIHKTWMNRSGKAFVSRWKNLTAAEKDAARLNPAKAIEDLLPYVRYETEYVYSQLPKVKISDLTDAYLNSKFHTHAKVMRDNVRTFADDIRSKYPKGESYGGRASVAQFYDKAENLESDLFSAFSNVEVQEGALKAVIDNVKGNINFNPNYPFLHPNVEELLAELIARKSIWQNGLSQSVKNSFYKELFRHADLRAFNDLACKRWGVDKLPRMEFDEWCSKDVIWFQELLRESKVNNVSTFIVHDPCRVCYYPTILVTKIR